jgi:putative transposase
VAVRSLISPADSLEPVYAAPVCRPSHLTPEQDHDLRRLSRAHKTPRKLAERADMILLSAAGMPVREIGRKFGVWPKTVRHWRACWLSSSVETSVAAKLADAARPGTPATFTPEQICAIMALACEPPEQNNLPPSHWSQSELAREAVRPGIVDSISHGSVGRFLTKRPTSSHIACAAG